jgi:HEAT repeat protein
LSLKRYLEELGDLNKPVKASRLTLLSDLSGEETQLLGKVWAKIPLERRRQIIAQLILLSEDNFQLNFDSVFKVCLQDPDALIREKAIEGLSECEQPSLIAPLIGLLKRDSEKSVRAAAAIALGRFALMAELETLPSRYGQQIEDALLSVIDDPEEEVEVRRRAVEAISSFSSPRIREIIEEAYDSEETKMRVSAIYAMGRNCDLVWLPILIRELENPDPEMRFEAARACGELGEEGAVPFLENRLSDPDLLVRLAAIEALGQIGGREAKGILHHLRRHPDAEIRQAAKEALMEAEFDDNPFGVIDFGQEDGE